MTLNYIVKGETEQPRSVVVLLHGSGQNASSMAQAAEIFSRTLPDALLLIPEGPRALPGCDGFDWFNPADLKGSPQQLAFNMKPVLDDLDALIDETLQKYGLADDRLALFGFSLGGMAALYAGQRREKPCAAVICHSSVYPVAVAPHAKPLTVMVMGARNIEGIAQDIRSGEAPAAFDYASSVARLQAQGVPVAEYIVPGLTHSMSAESLEKSAQIIGDGLVGGPGIRAALLPPGPGY